MGEAKTIFISHRGSEQSYANEVIAVLTAMGHKPVDMSHWDVGDDFIEQMEAALQECDAMIALMSPSYFESDMCKLELRVAMKLAKEGRTKFLAPYKIKDVSVSELYSTLIYGDFTKAVDRAALERRFPIANEIGEGPSEVNNLPQMTTQHFFGQEYYVADLHRVILHGNAVVSQTIQGLGGVGKTTLAIHYARLPEVAARFPIRWWVAAETREGMEKGLGDLGRRVGVVPDQTPDAEAAKQTLGWLREAPREALVLFDNVEDGPLLAEFLPGDATAALVTTRVRGMGGLTQVSLDCWQPETARDFLLDRTGSDDATAALALADALGGLPLACEQAGAYCAEAGETLAGYLARFQASPAKMMSKKAQGSAQEDTVAKTFALAIDRAAANCAGARAMLSLMAELAPEPLPLAVFGQEKAPEGLRDAEDASDAADALVR